MRKLPAALAALSLAAVALTGCATPSYSTDECVRPASDDAVADFATVSGELGTEPNVRISAPVRVSETAFTEPISGSGPRLQADNQLALIEVALFDAATGDRLIATPFDPAVTPMSTIGHWSQQMPGLRDVLDCAAGGSRIVAALSPEGVGQGMQQAQGLGPGESIIAVVDVVSSLLTRAEGSRVFNTGSGLPAVVRAPDGRPGIQVPDAAPPSELVTKVLIKGDGEPVTDERPFWAHYTGVTWADKEVFDSSWGGEASAFSLEGVVPGVAEALEGQTVGSQVMVVVPPELGYGDAERPKIPAGSTLVFVFDILGIDTAPVE